jgi:hypothetical protein
MVILEELHLASKNGYEASWFRHLQRIGRDEWICYKIYQYAPKDRRERGEG